MDSIPSDLINEIFSRLPAKSIARFHCLSKLWCAMFYSPYFTELFLTRSSARPRLLFAVEGKDAWRFFSLPQPHNSYKNSPSLEVASKMASSSYRGILRGYASGLICFRKTQGDEDTVVCNPITGQHAILPRVRKVSSSRPLLGFDPIDKQYKVLSIERGGRYRIMTLETGNMSWRKIQYPAKHNILREGICINGVLYYLAYTYDDTSSVKIVCFDVRSEKFKVIDTCVYEWPRRLININYKGKFGWTDLEYDSAKEAYKLYMWVLEDVEKQEISKYVYTFPDDIKVKRCLMVVGATATGEIVLSSTYRTYKPFYVLYFNPKRNTLQTVEIQGIYAPSMKNKPKPQHQEYGAGMNREKKRRERNE
ncbi:unnamed protein product [Microthlaspi erraticum]|uniref:F-box domain-containing protein n=1 Tax=Microthlaspi erraticum TaxID=1685480 RepID=A0A6D2L8T2_9BRAS|nr:unnamed protein product [Microthlaspi erraticum]